MSSADTTSTMEELFFFAAIESWMLLRIPVTTTSSMVSPGCAAVAAGAVCARAALVAAINSTAQPVAVEDTANMPRREAGCVQ